jgi:SepF-like predicted cell division protein (DUF552 family)
MSEGEGINAVVVGAVVAQLGNEVVLVTPES